MSAAQILLGPCPFKSAIDAPDSAEEGFTNRDFDDMFMNTLESAQKSGKGENEVKGVHLKLKRLGGFGMVKWKIVVEQDSAQVSGTVMIDKFAELGMPLISSSVSVRLFEFFIIAFFNIAVGGLQSAVFEWNTTNTIVHALMKEIQPMLDLGNFGIGPEQMMCVARYGNTHHRGTSDIVQSWAFKK